MMVKRKNYPISRQIFANAFAETPNLNLEVRRMNVADDNTWERCKSAAAGDREQL